MMLAILDFLLDLDRAGVARELAANGSTAEIVDR